MVKSRGRISFMNKQGEMDSKTECHVHYEAFPFSEITFGKDALARLPEKVIVFLEETGMDVSNNQE